MNVILPDWISDKELEQGSGAYETLDPALRALLKTQISLLHEGWLSAETATGSIACLSDGGNCFSSAKPLNWALFILSEDYASPAGCIAALLPALSAGVESVIVCRLGNPKIPLDPAISAAMELLGREEVYALSSAQSGRLVSDIMAQNPNGRVVVLGSETRSAYFVPSLVKIGLEEGAAPDRYILSWLHPAAQVGAVRPGASYDAVITASPDFYGDYQAPVVLGPGYEYFWRWPGLSPEFFQQKRFLLTRNPR